MAQLWSFVILIAGANYVYGSLFRLPDCTHPNHLSTDQRREVAAKLFVKPPLNRYHSKYECSLEKQAAEYIAVSLNEEERRQCPSDRKCLSYWSYNIGSKFTDFLNAALIKWEWNKNLTAVGSADQVGCSYSEVYPTQEIACVFKPFEP